MPIFDRTALAVAFFILVITVAHILAPAEYNWRQNTISDLAAQGMANGWVMRLGFAGFGIALSLALWQRGFGNAADWGLLVYAVCVGLSGLFNALPWQAGITPGAAQGAAHSLFASVAGFAFTFAIAASIWNATTALERWMHLVFLLLVTAASALFGAAENHLLGVGMGVAQRCLYGISFVWLLLR